MTTITIANTKGGVGKSALACQLALEWALRGRRVLVLDADSQGSAVAWAEKRVALAPPLTEVGTGKRPREAEQLDNPTVIGVGDNVAAVLRQVKQDYDYVLVDTKGEKEGRPVSALGQSDLALVPVKPGGQELSALPEILTCVRASQDLREAHGLPPLRTAIVPNLVDMRTTLHRAGLRALRSSGYPIVGRVRQFTEIDTAMSLGHGVSRSSAAGYDLRELVDALEVHMEAKYVAI